LVEITNKPIDVQKVINKVKSPEAGGICVFIGTVRNHSRGREIVALEYEAYEEMAAKTINEIRDEIRLKWDVRKMAISHRVGALRVGDIAVVIAISTPHRKESFAACQYAIDRLKETVPIWKKEFTMDGESWIEPHA
jgi:molybdopterin synthase catalytic subunit